MVTRIVSAPTPLSESVTDALIVCTPARNDDVVTEPPVPRAPSRFERQAMAAVKLPSSRSEAVPTNVTGSPGSYTELSGGDVMVTVGRAESGKFRVTRAVSLTGVESFGVTARSSARFEAD